MKTYRCLAELAQTVINAGFSVLIDATFLKIWQRDLFRAVADELAVPFVILDIKASDEELTRRIKQRYNDASEATIEILHQQQQSAHPLSQEELTDAITIDTGNSNALDSYLAKIAEKLK